jgi:hypothetical protein
VIKKTSFSDPRGLRQIARQGRVGHFPPLSIDGGRSKTRHGPKKGVVFGEPLLTAISGRFKNCTLLGQKGHLNAPKRVKNRNIVETAKSGRKSLTYFLKNSGKGRFYHGKLV